MAVQTNYEVSSEGAVRHWEFTCARMTHNTPMETEPAEVTSLLLGTKITGTTLGIDPATITGLPAVTALVDVTHSAVYRHLVRNVLTYAGAEASWGTIAEGDPIYYDPSASMLALDLRLSTSPIRTGGGANTLFGFAVGADDADRATFPKGLATADTVLVAVMQRGA